MGSLFKVGSIVIHS